MATRITSLVATSLQQVFVIPFMIVENVDWIKNVLTNMPMITRCG